MCFTIFSKTKWWCSVCSLKTNTAALSMMMWYLEFSNLNEFSTSWIPCLLLSKLSGTQFHSCFHSYLAAQLCLQWPLRKYSLSHLQRQAIEWQFTTPKINKKDTFTLFLILIQISKSFGLNWTLRFNGLENVGEYYPNISKRGNERQPMRSSWHCI